MKPKLIYILLIFLGQTSYAQSLEPKNMLYNSNGIVVYKVEESHEFDNAKLHLNFLDNKKGTQEMLATFSVENYELKAPSKNNLTGLCASSKDGQHIHFIVDGKPYSALYENSYKWTDTPGVHTLLTFISRSNHQSIKNPSAYQLTNFTTKVDNSIKVKKSMNDLNAPYLFYSRPKGTYVDSDATNILLDFYLVNCKLSPTGYKVKVVLDKTNSFIVTEWTPMIITGLAMGNHQVELTLLNKDNQIVKNKFNPVSRPFILMKNPK